MLHKIFITTACVIFIGVAQSQAAIIIDQSQTTSDQTIAVFSQAGLAQSFKQTLDNITGASLFISNYGGAAIGNITISLYDDLPANGGTQLASGVDTGVGSNQWATVDFLSAIAVTPGDTYYLVFSSTNANMGLGGTGNVYPGGIVYAVDNMTNQNANFDYAFQTFADDAFSDPTSTPVPEPASLAVWGIGATALGVGARRRLKPAA